MKKHLIPIIIVGIICIASGLGVFIFSRQASELQGEIVALQQEAQALEAKAGKLGAEKQPAASDRVDLSAYFVPADGALGFVEYIESVAASSGLSYRISLFEAEQDAELAKHGREFLRTSLATTGSLKDTRSFISLIETLPYNVRINRIDLKKTGEAVASTGTKETWALIIDFSVVKIMEKTNS